MPRVLLGRVEINQDTRIVHRHVDGVTREGSDDRFGALREIRVNERVEQRAAEDHRMAVAPLVQRASGMSTSVISAAASAESTA